jgi:Tol biopolymer transport system component
MVGLIAAVFLSLPQLTAIAPEPGAQNVSSRAPIRLTFSQPMAQSSVEAAFKVLPPQPGTFSWAGNALMFTPSQPWPVGQVITVSVTGSTGQRGLPLKGLATWSFTVSQPRIAYLAGAVPNLWTLAVAETAQPQQVTTETVGIAGYDISPDGQSFVYAAQRADGGADLRTIDVDGARAALLVDCPNNACLSPVVSPDGQRVAYERQTLISNAGGTKAPGASHVHVYTPATGQDISVGEEANEARTPRWGPDGRLSYYDMTRQAIVVRDLGSGAVTYIPDASGEMGTWSPDSQYIIFPELSFPSVGPPDSALGVGEAPAHFASRLLRVAIATNAKTDLSGPGEVDDGSPDYSPSGEWLAFASKGPGNTTQWTPGRQIWLMHPDGQDARALTTDPVYNHSALMWNADGTALVYMRFNAAAPDQPAEIWTVNADGTGARRLVTGGYLPAWLP